MDKLFPLNNDYYIKGSAKPLYYSSSTSAKRRIFDILPVSEPMTPTFKKYPALCGVL